MFIISLTCVFCSDKLKLSVATGLFTLDSLFCFIVVIYFLSGICVSFLHLKIRVSLVCNGNVLCVWFDIIIIAFYIAFVIALTLAAFAI